MKRFLLTGCIVLLAMAVYAQRNFVLNNSADGQSTLMVFLPETEKATGRAIVCCPGGGYVGLCTDKEGTDWAPFFNEQGIALIVVNYRMPHGDRSIPIGDAENAIRTVRDSASVWHINPYDVGIMGFSAGGHLASTVATQSAFAVRPDFQILCYPVITMTGRLAHKGSVANLLGKDKDDEQVQKQNSCEERVLRHITPPALILVSDDDLTVPAHGNAVAYYQAMHKNHNHATLHVYPSGGHGWGFNSNFAYHDEMVHDIIRWLQQLKAPHQDAIRVACVGNSITDGSGIDLTYKYGYPAVLQDILGEGYHVRNYGKSARTLMNSADIPYMKEFCWKDCKDFNPDIVVIKLGTNDSKTHNWVHKDDFMKDMQQMIDELNALPAKPQIFLAFPAKAFIDSWTITDRVIADEIIPMIKKVAKKNNLKTIDLYTATAADRNLIQEDGIHPNAAGARRMAEVVGQAITDDR